jgi:hypothetical protein
MSETIDPLTTRYNALQSAITAAEAGMQTTFVLWNELTPAEQDEYLALARDCWPRTDLFVKRIIPATRQILDDEHAQQMADLNRPE